MTLDIKELLLNYAGDTSWWGESNHDEISSKNLDKLELLLSETEEFREQIISKLNEHITYNKNNGSSKGLHDKAKRIREKHILKEFIHTDFEKYWESEE
jgi:ubiquitin C-terminal hydrolase